VSWYVKARGHDGEVESIFCTSPEGVAANVLHLSTLGHDVWIEDQEGSPVRIQDFLPQREPGQA
jgi:hypothetical protein